MLIGCGLVLLVIRRCARSPSPGRLGCHSYLVGRVGDENFGHHLAREVMKDVDVSGITYDADLATGLTIILKCAEGQLRTTTSCPAYGNYCDTVLFSFFWGGGGRGGGGHAHFFFLPQLVTTAHAPWYARHSVPMHIAC